MLPQMIKKDSSNYQPYTTTKSNPSSRHLGKEEVARRKKVKQIRKEM